MKYEDITCPQCGGRISNKRELKVVKARAHNKIKCIAGAEYSACKYLDNATIAMKLEAIKMVLEKESVEIGNIHKETISRNFRKMINKGQYNEK